ncbi:hypothetical protein HZS_1313 [Henneguya salminicola]|nr:hypothetical protein HZS_1313 [Henneguya salminicola]
MCLGDSSQAVYSSIWNFNQKKSSFWNTFNLSKYPGFVNSVLPMVFDHAYFCLLDFKDNANITYDTNLRKFWGIDVTPTFEMPTTVSICPFFNPSNQ